MDYYWGRHSSDFELCNVSVMCTYSGATRGCVAPSRNIYVITGKRAPMGKNGHFIFRDP